MRRRKRKSALRKVLWIFSVGVIGIAASLAWLLLEPFGPSVETFIDIPAHTGSVGIATRLAQAGAIRSRWGFIALREAEGGTLKAGEYRFDRPTSLLEVYRRMQRGDVYTVQVVIPEGFNLFDVAQAVQTAGLCSRTTFLETAEKNVALARPWDPKAVSLEGYLFPDTYHFSRHVSATAILQVMTHRFGQVVVKLGVPVQETHRTVTMASLVEREVHLDAERPVVAGVFENRLRAGMPLQTDPAVVYASMLRGTWSGVIHRSELASDSAYNTYAHAGLPPGPICNPGVSALRAALHPESTDFLYFIANADGSTKFARSLAEHNANVAVYRKEQQPIP